MNEHEARLAIVARITDVLFDLAAEGMEPDEDADEMRDALGDAAELIMEALGLEVESIDDKAVIVRLASIDPNG